VCLCCPLICHSGCITTQRNVQQSRGWRVVGLEQPSPRVSVLLSPHVSVLLSPHVPVLCPLASWFCVLAPLYPHLHLTPPPSTFNVKTADYTPFHLPLQAKRESCAFVCTKVRPLRVHPPEFSSGQTTFPGAVTTDLRGTPPSHL